MINRSRSRHGIALAVGLAAIVASLVVGVFSGTAFGSSLSWYRCGEWGGSGSLRRFQLHQNRSEQSVLLVQADNGLIHHK